MRQTVEGATPNRRANSRRETTRRPLEERAFVFDVTVMRPITPPANELKNCGFGTASRLAARRAAGAAPAKRKAQLLRQCGDSAPD